MLRLAKRAVPVVLWLLSVAASAQTLPPPWMALGPFGGQVQTLTADPVHSGTLYATTPQGIFKTVDGGVSWTVSNLGAPSSNVAVDPVHPSTLYAGLFGSLLVKSIDGGVNWLLSNAGLPPGPDFAATRVVIDPSNPNRLLLIDLARVWRSTDAGRGWQEVTAGFSNGDSVFDLAFAAQPAGTAFAATATGLYRSTDAGASWQLVPGLTRNVIRVAVAPSDPRTVYAFDIDFGLYRSVDGGGSWQRATSRTDIFAHLFVSPRARRTLYASSFDGPLFRSTDGGATWAALPQVPGVTSVAFDAGAPQRIYAGALAQPLGGVWRSDDSGATWTRRNAGMTGLPATSLAVDPGAPEHLWLQSTGFFRSANRGVRWALAPSPGQPLEQLAVGDSGVLFAGLPQLLQLPHAPLFHALSRTADGGASWTTIFHVQEFNVSLIRTAPAQPSTVYAAGDVLDPAIGERFFRSTDNGITWELRSSSTPPLPFCGTTDLEVSPSAASILYLAGDGQIPPSTSCERVVLRSDDGGATWASVSTGLPEARVLALAVAPGDPDQVYAGTAGDGVWKSTDGGQTWSQTGGLAGQTVAALLASDVPGRIYAVAGSRVFRSDDGGTSWQGWSRGLRTSAVSSLVLDPGDASRIYAVTANGVWVLVERD